MIGLFVLGYVWQNVEVLKMKLSFANQRRELNTIREGNDLLIYKMEQITSFSRIQALAKEQEYRPIKPGDVRKLKKRKE